MIPRRPGRSVGAVSATATTERDAGHGIRWWPTALGVAAGIGVGLAGGLAPVILVCAAIYVLAAVTGRPNAAWIGFAASLPLVGVGIALRSELLSLALIGAATLVLIVVGVVRGAWAAPLNRLQLAGVVVFALLAVAVALLGSPVTAGIVAATGLLLHGAWDIWHHVRRAVVARPYAEFCAALDIVLAIVVLAALVL